MIKNKKKRDKRINSKDKGDRFERTVCNLFKKHWKVTAYRTPGSGAYTSRQVSKAMKEASIGDVVIEELPEFVIECKNYYSLHFTEWFKDTSKKKEDMSIWGFWNKLLIEAEKFNKIPLLICKEENSPVVVIMDVEHINIVEDYNGGVAPFMVMDKEDTQIVVFALNELLVLDLETIKIIIKDIVNKYKR